MPIIGVPYDETAAEAPSGNAFELTPEGWYDIQLVSHEIRPPKEAGKFPQLMLQGNIIGADTGVGVGRKMTHFQSCSPKASKALIQLLQGLGLPFEMAANPAGPVIQFNTDFLNGRTVRARCYHSKQEMGKRAGTMRENWVGWEPSRYGVSPGQNPLPAASGAPVSAPMQPGYNPNVAAPQAQPQPYVAPTAPVGPSAVPVAAPVIPGQGGQ